MGWELRLMVWMMRLALLKRGLWDFGWMDEVGIFDAFGKDL